MTSKNSLEYIFNLALNYTNSFSNQLGFRHNEAYEVIKQDLDRLEKLEKVIEILKKYIYYSQKSHCIRMREVRKSTKNFDYEDLKEVLENE